MFEVDSAGYKKYKNSKGQMHNEEGPALLHLDSNFSVWYIEDKQHREDGPAYINNEYIYWSIKDHKIA